MQLLQSKVNYAGLYRLPARNEPETSEMTLNTTMVSSCSNAKVTIATQPNIDLHCFKLETASLTPETTVLSAS